MNTTIEFYSFVWYYSIMKGLEKAVIDLNKVRRRIVRMKTLGRVPEEPANRVLRKLLDFGGELSRLAELEIDGHYEAGL